MKWHNLCRKAILRLLYCAISKILATLYYPLHAKHLESVYTLFIVRITMTDSFESTGLQSLTLKRVIIRKSIKPFHFLCIANLIIDSHHPIRKTLIRNDQSIACSAWFCTRYLVVKIRKNWTATRILNNWNSMSKKRLRNYKKSKNSTNRKCFVFFVRLLYPFLSS